MKEPSKAIVEKHYVSERWTKLHWAAILLLLSAFACAAYFGKSEALTTRKWSGAYFGYALLSSTVIWGLINLKTGRVRGKRRYYAKERNPKMFALIMVLKIGIPSLCGLMIGLFYTFAYSQ